jgi:hypothetical protein
MAPFKVLTVLLLGALTGCLPAFKDKSGGKGTSGNNGNGGNSGGGSDGGVGEGNGPPGTPPPTQLPALDACGANPAQPGPRVLRRLTQSQLNATLKDLFRDPSVPQASFFSDPPVLGFTVDANALVVQDLTAQQLSDFADQVATWVDAHPASVTSCTTTDATCVGQFIAAFGKRAFRAPLTSAQLAAYTTLFNAQGNFQDGLHTVVAAMMQSPYFLYRQELGTPNAQGTLFNLTPHEVAASLSYLLIGSMPDDALFAAADANQLATAAQLDAQAKRLLADPRAQTAVADFMTGWLGLDRVLTTVKDASVYSALTSALRASMYNESRALLVDTFTSGLSFGDALTANYSFLDTGLAQYYGVPGGGATATKVMLPAGVRDKGLLAHGAITTGYADADISSPVQRGKLVRLRLLCQSLPPPPGGLATALAPASGVQTTRQHFEQHDKVEPCAGCHEYIDPVGFGFESYDGIGRRRTSDNGLPVDPSGTIKAMTSGASDVNFANLNGLASYLASDPDVNSCLARYWTYYAFGMSSWPEDGCTHDAVAANASMNGYSLQSVLSAIWHAPHFISRVADQ